MPIDGNGIASLYMEASGIQFELDSKNTKYQVDIDDIVRSLARIRRFNDQTCRPYSVAQHSMMVADIVRNEYGAGPQIELQALVHDATETWIGDIPAPVKWLVPEIRDMEHVLWTSVATTLRVHKEMHAWVKRADWLALFIEARSLCTHSKLGNWSHFEEHRVELENLWPRYRISRGPIARFLSLPFIVEWRFRRRLVKVMRAARAEQRSVYVRT